MGDLSPERVFSFYSHYFPSRLSILPLNTSFLLFMYVWPESHFTSELSSRNVEKVEFSFGEKMELWVREKIETCRDTMLCELQQRCAQTTADGPERCYALEALVLCRDQWAGCLNDIPLSDKVDTSRLPEEQCVAMLRINQALRKQVQEQNAIAYEMFTTIAGKSCEPTRTLSDMHKRLREEVHKLQQEMFAVQHSDSELSDKDLSLGDLLRVAEFKLNQAATHAHAPIVSSASDPATQNMELEVELRAQDLTKEMQSKAARLERQLEAEKSATAEVARNARLEIERIQRECTAKLEKQKNAAEVELKQVRENLQEDIRNLTNDYESKLQLLNEEFAHLLATQKEADTEAHRVDVAKLRATLAERTKQETMTLQQELAKQALAAVEAQQHAPHPSRGGVDIDEDVHAIWEGEDKETLMQLLQSKRAETVMMQTTHAIQMKARTLEWESVLRETISKYERDVSVLRGELESERQHSSKLVAVTETKNKEIASAKSELVRQQEIADERLREAERDASEHYNNLHKQHNEALKTLSAKQEECHVLTLHSEEMQRNFESRESDMTATIHELRKLADRPQLTVPDQHKQTQTYAFETRRSPANPALAPGPPIDSLAAGGALLGATPRSFDLEAVSSGATSETASAAPTTQKKKRPKHSARRKSGRDTDGATTDDNVKAATSLSTSTKDSKRTDEVPKAKSPAPPRSSRVTASERASSRGYLKPLRHSSTEESDTQAHPQRAAGSPPPPDSSAATSRKGPTSWTEVNADVAASTFPGVMMEGVAENVTCDTADNIFLTGTHLPSLQSDLSKKKLAHARGHGRHGEQIDGVHAQTARNTQSSNAREVPTDPHVASAFSRKAMERRPGAEDAVTANRVSLASAPTVLPPHMPVQPLNVKMMEEARSSEHEGKNANAAGSSQRCSHIASEDQLHEVLAKMARVSDHGLSLSGASSPMVDKLQRTTKRDFTSSAVTAVPPPPVDIEEFQDATLFLREQLAANLRKYSPVSAAAARVAKEMEGLLQRLWELSTVQPLKENSRGLAAPTARNALILILEVVKRSSKLQQLLELGGGPAARGRSPAMMLVTTAVLDCQEGKENSASTRANEHYVATANIVSTTAQVRNLAAAHATGHWTSSDVASR